MASSRDPPATKVESAVEKAASPIATLSSHADPWPAYLMSGICGGASMYAFYTANNPRQAAIQTVLAGAYIWAGRLLVTGNPTLGYDIGTVASVALTAIAAPPALAAGGAYNVALASTGGISAVANLIKSYEMRTGRPREMGFERERR